MSTTQEIKKELEAHANPAKAEFAANWFKNRPGYPPDDLFLGVTVPTQRSIAHKHYKGISLHDTGLLLSGRLHEERLTALFILVNKYEKFPFNRQAIFDMYFEHLPDINNWDLVDSSAPYIVGEHLQGSDYKMKVLTKLAKSDGVWSRRIAMLAAGRSQRYGDAQDTIRIAELLLHDKDDYIHKAVGWMIREMGKRVGKRYLTNFLDTHAGVMPRTMLRYAIEHLDSSTKKHYMSVK